MPLRSFISELRWHEITNSESSYPLWSLSNRLFCCPQWSGRGGFYLFMDFLFWLSFLMLLELVEISLGLPSLLSCRFSFDNLPVFIFQEIGMHPYGLSVWSWVRNQLLGCLNSFYYLEGSSNLFLWWLWCLSTWHHVDGGKPIVFIKSDDSIFPHLVDLLYYNKALIEWMWDHLVIWTIPRIVGFANISQSFGVGQGWTFPRICLETRLLELCTKRDSLSSWTFLHSSYGGLITFSLSVSSSLALARISSTSFLVRRDPHFDGSKELHHFPDTEGLEGGFPS